MTKHICFADKSTMFFRQLFNLGFPYTFVHDFTLHPGALKNKASVCMTGESNSIELYLFLKIVVSAINN